MAARDWSADTDWSSLGGPDRRSSWGSPPTIFRTDTYTTASDPACGTDPLVSSIRFSSNGGTVCGFNIAQYQDLYGAFERTGASLSGRYEIKSGISVFGDVLYSDTRGESKQAPQANLSSPFMETLTGAPLVPSDHPGNPFGKEGELFSRMLEGGQRVHLNEAAAYRAVLGLEGPWGDWDWRQTSLEEYFREYGWNDFCRATSPEDFECT